MAKHLQRDLDSLTKNIVQLGGIVEILIKDAIASITQRRKELAKKVLEDGLEVDKREVHIEEECLKILALHQPVATDLRFIITCLKMNNDLERMGDYAENLAARAIELAKVEPVAFPSNFIEAMTYEVENMLSDSLQALVDNDVDLARKIIERDDLVDKLHKKAYKEVNKMIMEDPSKTDVLTQCLSVSRYLERIADLTTNISEDIIFMVEGEVIRHQEKIDM